MQQDFRRLMPVLNFRNSTLQSLCAKTVEQADVLNKIKTMLPVDLREHVLHCVTGTKTLSVYSDSANWATQLRFYSTAMLDAANTYAAGNVYSVRVKILPTFNRQKPNRKPLIPSQATLEVLKSHTETVTEPQLKASLMRLSVTLARLQQDKT